MIKKMIKKYLKISKQKDNFKNTNIGLTLDSEFVSVNSLGI